MESKHTTAVEEKHDGQLVVKQEKRIWRVVVGPVKDFVAVRRLKAADNNDAIMNMSMKF